MSRVGIASVLSVALGACSALVDPDPSRLGGELDASVADAEARDGSGELDGGLDAGSDAATDTGVECPEGCDDGVACTVDRCADGRCVHTPDDTACGADERCAAELGCVAMRCTSDAECDDGRPCNGQEVCDGSDPETGCGPGVPLDCDDGILCTVDACADAAGGCVHEPRDAACDDGVACTHDRCDLSAGCVNTPDDAACDDGLCFMGGTCDPDRGCVGSVVRDCRDGDPCTADDCDPATGCFSVPRDDDGDGFPTRFAGRTCEGGTDCNDDNPDVYPGATELCNRRDDDCDTVVDEGGACSDLPDACDSAQPIALSGAPLTGSVTGALASLRDDYSTDCGSGGSAPDAIYYVDVPAGTHDVRVDTLGSAFDTVLAVTDTCGTFDYAGRGCNDDIERGANTRSRIWVHRFRATTGPRRLYILVEPYSAGAAGPYTVNVQVTDAAADSCSAVLDIGEGGTVVGAAGLGVGAQRGSCQPTSEIVTEEAVFRFRPRSDAGASFDAWADGFTPTLYVRGNCTDAGSEVACARGDSGGGVNEVTLDVASGNFVFLDGMSAGSLYTLRYDP